MVTYAFDGCVALDEINLDILHKQIILMYRIYLDWNVFAMLRSQDQSQTALKLRTLLSANLLNLLVPFSTTHIQDLLKGSDNPDFIPLIKKDLDLINIISKGHFIEYDLQSDRLSPKIADSHEWFEAIQETSNEPLFSLDHFLESFSVLGLKSQGESFINTWKNTPTGIDFNKFDHQAGANQLNDIFFKRTRIENNMLNLMMDMTDFYTEIKRNPDVYKNLGKLYRETLKIDPKELSNSLDPITEINLLLKAANIDLDFDRIGRIKSNTNNPYESSFFIKFTTEIGNLDLSGFHPDKLSEKNNYLNYTNDSHHVFYAGACDYFITNESKLIKKANVMYRKYSIDCKALKPLEFIIEMKTKLNFEITADSFVTSINNTIDHHFIKDIEDQNFTGLIKLFKPEIRILGYFNFLYTISYNDDRRTLIFRHLPKDFSNFSYFTELQSIFTKLYLVLGPDISNLGEPKIDDLSENKNIEIYERAWVFDNYFCIASFEENKTHIRFEMNKLTETFLNSL